MAADAQPAAMIRSGALNLSIPQHRLEGGASP